MVSRWHGGCATAVTWDKHFARQILDKIVVYSR